MQRIQESRDINISPATALQQIASKAFLEQLYASQNSENPRIEVLQDDDTAFHATVTRDVRIRDKAPGFAKKLVKEVVEVVHEHKWSRSGDYAGNFNVEFSGMPGSLAAEMTLTELDNNSLRFDMDGGVTVSIPLIGGKLEKYLAGVVSEKFKGFMSDTAAQLES